MEEKCYNCKYENLSTKEQPCCDCFDHSFWIAKDNRPRDSKLIWSELVGMYSKALGDCEGIDYDTYDIMCDRFREKLSELGEAIKEEYW